MAVNKRKAQHSDMAERKRLSSKDENRLLLLELDALSLQNESLADGRQRAAVNTIINAALLSEGKKVIIVKPCDVQGKSLINNPIEIVAA